MTTRSTFSILFFLKKKTNDKQAEAQIYMRITIDGQRSETSIKRSILPSQWDTNKYRAKPSYEFHRDLNHYLDHTRNQVFIQQQELEKRNKVISARTLRDCYLRRDDAKRTILQTYQEHNERLFHMIDNGIAYNTYKRHLTSKDHVERFIRLKYNRPDYYLKDITPEFIDRYESYFRVERGCNTNTTAKYIKNFAKIVRWAMKNEWISTNPLRNLKLKYEPVRKEFLTQDELDAIREKNFAIERVAIVRDIFLFCCFTGLSYIDVHGLKYDNIVSLSETQGIRVARHKTKQETFIPLLPPALDIIEKYRSHSTCISQNKVLPVISNQKMNAYLKEIADICGITKNVTCHTARHTFATTVTLANNISMESVSKMLGHSDMAITKIYARILDRTVINEMNRLATSQY